MKHGKIQEHAHTNNIENAKGNFVNSRRGSYFVFFNISNFPLRHFPRSVLGKLSLTTHAHTHTQFHSEFWMGAKTPW